MVKTGHLSVIVIVHLHYTLSYHFEWQQTGSDSIRIANRKRCNGSERRETILHRVGQKVTDHRTERDFPLHLH